MECKVFVIGSILLLCAVQIQSAVPQQRTGGAETCDERGNALQFLTTRTYLYDFSSLTTVRMFEESTLPRSISVEAKARLTKVAPCEFIVSLEKLKLENADSKVPASFKKAENSVFRFTWNNGSIDNILTSNSNETWLMNIQKGIASMLQNKAFSANSGKLSTFDGLEKSISGVCPVSYEKETNTKFIKTINLNECLQREDIPFTKYGNAYNEKVQIPVTDSSLVCKYSVENEILQSVECTEKQKLNEYSRFDWQTRVESSLTLINTENLQYSTKNVNEIREKANVSSTITFTQNQSSEILKGNINERVTSILSKLKRDMNTDFGNDYEELLELLKEVENPRELVTVAVGMGKRVQELLFSAIAETDTIGSLKMMAFALQRNYLYDLNYLTKVRFYRTIMYSANPSVEGLDALLPLVRTVRNISSQMDDPTSTTESLNDYIFFGASGYAYQFCKQNTDSCANSRSYSRLMDAIALHVNFEDYTVSVPGYGVPYSALQALANFRNLTTLSIQKIVYLLNAPKEYVISSNLHVSALKAFRNDPCVQKLKENARSLFGNNELEEDVRIEAYLAMTRCLDAKDINAIKLVFDDLESLHVTKFIASHISGVQNSLSPSKRKLQGILSESKLSSSLPSKESLDAVEESSKYYEYSYFDVKLNLGFSAEAVLMFRNISRTKPVATTIQLTVDAFGRSYTLLEVGSSLRFLKSYAYNLLGEEENSILLKGIHFFKGVIYKDSYFRSLGVTCAVGAIKKPNERPVVEELTKFAMRLPYMRSDTLQEFVDILPFTLNSFKMSYPSISGFPLTVEKKIRYVQFLEIILKRYSLLLALINQRSDTSGVVKMSYQTFTSVASELSLKMGTKYGTPMSTGILGKTLLASLEFSEMEFKKKQISEQGSDKYLFKIVYPQDVISSSTFSGKYNYVETIDSNVENLPCGVGDESPRRRNTTTCYGDVMNTLMGVQFCTNYEDTYSVSGCLESKFSHFWKKSESSIKEHDITLAIGSGRDGQMSYNFTMDTVGSSTNRKISVKVTSEDEYGGTYDHVIKGKAETPLANRTDFILELGSSMNWTTSLKTSSFSLKYYLNKDKNATHKLRGVFSRVSDAWERKNTGQLEISYLPPSNKTIESLQPISIFGQYNTSRLDNSTASLHYKVGGDFPTEFKWNGLYNYTLVYRSVSEVLESGKMVSLNNRISYKGGCMEDDSEESLCTEVVRNLDASYSDLGNIENRTVLLNVENYGSGGNASYELLKQSSNSNENGLIRVTSVSKNLFVEDTIVLEIPYAIKTELNDATVIQANATMIGTGLYPQTGELKRELRVQSNSTINFTPYSKIQVSEKGGFDGEIGNFNWNHVLRINNDEFLLSRNITENPLLLENMFHHITSNN